MKKNFPYSVKDEYAKLNDGQCCSEVWGEGSWQHHRCRAKAKECIDGVGLCGTHIRSLKEWRKWL